MPDNRAARDRLAKQKGIYFDHTLTADEKRYKEYAQHVATGGDRIDSKELLPKAPDTKPILKEKIMKSWRKGGHVVD